MCSLRDLLKVARLLLDKGIYKGKQLVPSDYIYEATSNQVDTILQPYLDEQLGYGYQIWQTRNGGFSFYGIGGQLAVCLPEEDFILVTMADTLSNPSGIKDIYDSFFLHIYPYISQKETSDSKNKLRGSLDNIARTRTALSARDLSSFEFMSYLDSHTLGHQINDLEFAFDENKLGIEKLQLHLDDYKGILNFVLNGQEQEVLFETENRLGKLKTHNYLSYSSATWLRENVFYIKTYLMDEYLANLSALLVFRENTVTIRFTHAEKAVFKNYAGIATGTYLKSV